VNIVTVGFTAIMRQITDMPQRKLEPSLKPTSLADTLNT